MRQLAAADLPALVGDSAASGGLLVLDVREAWELDLARLRLPGATLRHLPMSRLADEWGELAALDRARPIVCFCHHGVRSAHVAAFLQRQGFCTVYNLAGGIDAWSLQVDGSVARYRGPPATA